MKIHFGKNIWPFLSVIIWQDVTLTWNNSIIHLLYIYIYIWVGSWRCSCLITQFSYQLTAKPGSTLKWLHNEHDGIANRQPYDCLLNRLFRRRSKKTSKLCVTGLCEGNSPVTGEFPAQKASYAENVSIWWRHQEDSCTSVTTHMTNTFWLLSNVC